MQPMVITVAQQKGGAGKTTLAASLAAAYAATKRVALVDIDPQRSLTRWHALRAKRPNAPAITLAEIAGWRLASEIGKLRRGNDIIIIDSPPQIDTDARQAVRHADLVLVPMQPSPPDLWAAEGTFELARAEKRRLAIVLNRAPAAGRLRAAVEAELASGKHHLLPTALGNRTGFATAFAQGLGVTETAPKSRAADELRALIADIEAFIA